MHLEHLTAAEKQALIDAFPYVLLLVAGADGVIDENELETAEKVAQVRSFATDVDFKHFYTEVSDHLLSRLEALKANLPDDVAEQQAIISAELSRLNEIFPKIDYISAKKLYKDLLSFAKHIAKASGGFAGFLSVSNEEADVLNLSMINPIE
ncbi:MAG TPA: hypothetical protein PKA00_10200 [Saprospiraceae bacterium]|nr:hypothetical protein [Saprospiraceae bacterium]HMQ83270.1 hypothetical protein [Saprospiraceae bacterium]